MYMITKSIYTETSHKLTGHPGKCCNFHGHSYKWTVGVKSSDLDSDMMVMDFSELKNLMTRFIMPFDHATVFDRETFDDIKSKLQPTVSMKDIFGSRIIILEYPPTAENMAAYVYAGFGLELEGTGIEIVFVKCRETENSEAAYYEKQKS